MRESSMEKGLVIDEFAGGGGASLGIARAIGREVDIAVNHDPAAVHMHSINHPRTLHYTADVYKIDPVKVCKGRAVWFAWFSPDCRHFSRAKGAKPVLRRIRGLAHIANIWAQRVRPSIIFLENVREFQDWGPLIPRLDYAGRVMTDIKGNPQLVPDPTRRGKSFKRFVARFENLGYKVEWRDMDAADYGANTHRRRLFLIARCDGQPIVWPARTHAAPEKAEALGLLPWNGMAECIDWSLHCPSIFERKKPLAPNTMRRIAHGFMRYVKNAAKPFIVGVGGRMAQTQPKSVDMPLPAITGKNDKVVCVPYVVQSAHGGHNYRAQSVTQPVNSILASNAHAIAAPYLVRIGQTGSNGKNCHDAREPLGSVVSKNEHLVCTPYLVGAGGPSYKGKPKPVDAPIGTLIGENHAVLIAPFLLQQGHIGGVACRVQGVSEPIKTLTAGREKTLMAPYLVHLNHGDKQWSSVDEPLSVNHAAEVRAFLIKYYGAEKDGQPCDEPLGTVTANDRFGLVTVTINGETYIVVDIGMRMLTPRELARAQGFPDSYILTGSAKNQVARIGNSVCPVMAEVIVRANALQLTAKVEVAA